MGAGDFSMPPKGVKLGPTVDYSKLSKDEQADLGDFVKLKNLSTETPDTVEDKSELGADTLEAYKEVIENDQPATPEPETSTISQLSAPTDEDKQQFIRCLLGDRRYERDYSFYNDTIVVSMQESSVTEEQLISKTMADAIHAGEVDSETALANYYEDLRIQHNITKIVVGARTLDLNNLKANLNSTTYNTLKLAVRVFEEHLNQILDRSLDPDFWQAAGQD